jgi:outer membrane protein OmpA-like peptidoglycan-associated protein
VWLVGPAVLVAVAVVALMGCASKAYVREQVGGTDARLAQTSQRVDGQEARLRETTDQVDAGRKRLEGLDAKVGEVGTLALQANERAGEARKTADDASSSARDIEGRLSGRIANRNRYAALDTRSVYFDFGRSELKDDAINALREVARALREDPNAVLELRGHTDALGPDRANLALSRERVDAIVRFLVQKEGVELRRLHAVGLGKATPVADNNTRDGRARNRRVDVTLLSTQS